MKDLIVVSEGNEYTKLRNAFNYWYALDNDNEFKEGAYLVTMAMLKGYNDSCTEEMDELDENELEWLFVE